jgi:regulator of protease activity HflC (stomatin/prohibitin superfamily)
MAKTLIFLIFMAVFFAVFVAKARVIVDEDERLVVFRLGQLLQVYPPGRITLIPFIDRGVKVKVDQITGWRTLSEEKLQERLVQAAMQNYRT